MPRLTFPTLIVVALCSNSQAQPPRTLAYDGFRTTESSSTYRENYPIGRCGAPTLNTVGFSRDVGWEGPTGYVLMRDAEEVELTHLLLPSVQPGAAGVPTFRVTSVTRRNLAEPPVARSGVYTLSLLFRAHDREEPNKYAADGHTTAFPNLRGMVGFTPDNPGNGEQERDGDHGSRGLSLGYSETDLCVFAGKTSVSILHGYAEDKTYLLVAEMTVDADGPEFIRGFYAEPDDEELRPAEFNALNGGKGISLESWSSPGDMEELEFFLNNASKRTVSGPRKNGTVLDLVTFDEVRLTDGTATLPLPGGRPEDLIEGLPSLGARTEKIVAHWAFDEAKGDTTQDSRGKANAKLLGATFTPEAAQGASALKFKPTRRGGSVMAEISHREASEQGLVFSRSQPLSVSAWVRGDLEDFNDILSKGHSGQASRSSFRDVKGFAFGVHDRKLRLDMVNSINLPKKDDKLSVEGDREIPDDGKYHHVVLSYDGSSRAAGVRFFIDGVEDKGRSVNSEEDGHKLTRPINVVAPVNIGGRNSDRKDRFGFGFDGEIDELSVFNYALTRAEAVAVYRLAGSELGYNLEQLDTLFRLARAGKGQLTIGGLTWYPIGPGGLHDDPGEFLNQGRLWSVRLGDDGSGLMTK